MELQGDDGEMLSREGAELMLALVKKPEVLPIRAAFYMTAAIFKSPPARISSIFYWA